MHILSVFLGSLNTAKGAKTHGYTRCAGAERRSLDLRPTRH